MKYLNILLIFIISILLFSCKSRGIYQSGEIIKNIERNKDLSNYYNLSYQKERNKINNNYTNIFKFRYKRVNSFLKKQRIKDFILEELFYYNPIKNGLKYTVYIIDKDSAYGFTFEELKYTIKKSSLQEYNKDRKYFTFKNDSILINKGITYNKNEHFPSYISTYENSRLDLLLVADSIIYKKENSKTNLNMNIKKWYQDDKECSENKGMIKCIDIR